MTIAGLSLDPNYFSTGLIYDPEDPMCAKLTIQGTMTKASLSGHQDVAVGKQALLARHPQMKKWPAG